MAEESAELTVVISYKWRNNEYIEEAAHEWINKWMSEWLNKLMCEKSYE